MVFDWWPMGDRNADDPLIATAIRIGSSDAPMLSAAGVDHCGQHPIRCSRRAINDHQPSLAVY